MYVFGMYVCSYMMDCCEVVIVFVNGLVDIVIDVLLIGDLYLY